MDNFAAQSAEQASIAVPCSWDTYGKKMGSPSKSIVNSKRQESKDSPIGKAKTNHYNQVVEQQVLRIIQKKIDDPVLVMKKTLGIDFRFIDMLNRLHDGSATLRYLSEDVRQFGWLEQNILKVANMPFMQEDSASKEVMIKELDHALPFLGQNANQVIVPYLFLRHVIQRNHNGLLPDVGKRLWFYTLNVANVALEAAELTGVGNAQVAYTAGIFHGLSYVAIYKLFIESFEEVRQANFDLARKQFKKDLFTAMQLLTPQRNHLSGFIDKLGTELSINLMNAFSGQHLDLNGANPHLLDVSKLEGKSIPVKQAITFGDAKMLSRDEAISKHEVVHYLQNVGMSKALIREIKKNKLSSLDVFKRQKDGVKFGVLDEFNTVAS